MRFSILTILTIATTTVFAQIVKKCDETILRSTSEKIGRLTQAEITNFLLTFGEECGNNAEYSEWSNELLFSILGKQTELIVRTIAREEKRIEINEILDDLSSPIHDAINIKDIISKIDIHQQLKEKFIERLKEAEKKAN